VAVGVAGGREKTNGRWHSHKKELGARESFIELEISRDAPEPSTGHRLISPLSRTPQFPHRIRPVGGAHSSFRDHPRRRRPRPNENCRLRMR
jgi:hypothetical protein